jgi:hypothetical protein
MSNNPVTCRGVSGTAVGDVEGAMTNVTHEKPELTLGV